MSNQSTGERPLKDIIFKFLFKYGTIIAIFVAIAFFSIKTPYFLTPSNIADILRSVCIVTLMAIGVTFSETTGGFDVSVGSITGFATILSASMMVWFDMPLIIVILVPVLAGVLVGLWNSLLIEKFKIPDILATLSSLFIFQGALITYTRGSAIYTNMVLPDGGKAIGRFSEVFLEIGQGTIMGVPNPVIIVFVLMLISHIFLNYTKYGRFLYMTGGNREAARLSGVNVVKYRVLSYVLSGLFAALGGVLLATRIGVGEVNAGAPLLMDAVAASYIGFSVLGKGKPNVIGTFVGAVLMGLLLNGLTMLNVAYYAQDIVKGTVLVLALGLTYATEKK